MKAPGDCELVHKANLQSTHTTVYGIPTIPQVGNRGANGEPREEHVMEEFYWFFLLVTFAIVFIWSFWRSYQRGDNHD